MNEEHQTLYPTNEEIEAIREFKARYGPYGFECTYPTSAVTTPDPVRPPPSVRRRKPRDESTD